MRQLVSILFINGLVYAENFSFAILADPHITCNETKIDQINSAVNWIVSNKEATKIELVFVLGDIAWGACGQERSLVVAKRILDQLNEAGILYVPVIGDNEVQTTSTKEFYSTFEPQYKKLAELFPQFRSKITFVEDKYLCSFSFDYKECHFICPDFLSRVPGNEGGDLHDYEGGTWPWFINDIKTAPKTKQENIVIMTHIGLFHTGFSFFDQFLFSGEQINKIKENLYPYRSHVASNYAGHIHMNWYAAVSAGLNEKIYDVWITDECWRDTTHGDYSITVRWVEVDTSNETITYLQHLEILPE